MPDQIQRLFIECATSTGEMKPFWASTGFTPATLLLTGDPSKGAIVSPETAREVVGLSSSIRVVNIPGVGHSIRRENYPRFMQAVIAFLDEVKGM